MLDIIITPTYSGCPAMQRIEDDIIEKFGKENGNVSSRAVFIVPCMDY